MKVLLAITACRGEVDVRTLECTLETVRACRPLFEVCPVFICDESLLTTAKNAAFAEFLRGDAQFLFIPSGAFTGARLLDLVGRGATQALEGFVNRATAAAMVERFPERRGMFFNTEVHDGRLLTDVECFERLALLSAPV